MQVFPMTTISPTSIHRIFARLIAPFMLFFAFTACKKSDGTDSSGNNSFQRAIDEALDPVIAAHKNAIRRARDAGDNQVVIKDAFVAFAGTINPVKFRATCRVSHVLEDAVVFQYSYNYPLNDYYNNYVEICSSPTKIQRVTSPFQISHDPYRNTGTIIFRIQDKELLRGIQSGDPIKIEGQIRVADNPTISKIQLVFEKLHMSLPDSQNGESK